MTSSWKPSQTLREKLLKAVDSYDCSYKTIVKLVVEAVGAPLDPDRISEIDWGNYQGYLCFVIGAEGYQPMEHWGVVIGYGSCSGCDTLEAIKSDGDDDETKAKKLLAIATHIVQRLKPIHSASYYDNSVSKED